MLILQSSENYDIKIFGCNRFGYYYNTNDLICEEEAKIIEVPSTIDSLVFGRNKLLYTLENKP